MRRRLLALFLSMATGAFLMAQDGSPEPASAPTAVRGEYLFRAGGCINCHTDASGQSSIPAGGHAIETTFGTFYGTNITPDPDDGIGQWSDSDFLRAMREGRAPDGSSYWPVFPYTSFSRMSDEDISAIKAYLFTLPPTKKANRPHQIKRLFRPGILLAFWRRLYFRPGPMSPEPGRSAAWNRGAYLVQALSHCGQCHTPRDRLGGIDERRAMAGAPYGIEGGAAPNITPDRETGIGGWSESDLSFFLKTGLTPDGDVTGGSMRQVVENGTRYLPDADLEAMATYLLSLPPIRFDPRHRSDPRRSDPRDTETDPDEPW